jgi:hypothetical protein
LLYFSPLELIQRKTLPFRSVVITERITEIRIRIRIDTPYAAFH